MATREPDTRQPSGDGRPGSPAGAAPDDRRAPRVTLNKEFASFDAFVDDYVLNVSRQGVFIRSRDPLPVGTAVDLHFSVLADGEPGSVEGVGRVVRVQSDPPGMGVVFTRVDRASQGLLDRLLVERPQGPLPTGGSQNP